MHQRFYFMLKPITFALLVLAALIGFYGTALAQTVPIPPPQGAPSQPPYVYTPPPQQPVAVRPAIAPGPLVPAPFGGLYNVISGKQPAAPGQKQPLTPFNTQPLP